MHGKSVKNHAGIWRRLSVVHSCITLAWVHAGMAGIYTWSTGTSGAATDGSETWNTTTANWVGAGDVHTIWNNANGDTAVFGAGGTAGTVTISSGGVTVGGLTFNATLANGTYVLAGGPLTLTGTPVFQADTHATMNVAITGTAGFTKTGTGTLTFSNPNSAFTGDVTLVEGTVLCTSGNIEGTNSVLGRADVSRTITVSNSAKLQFNTHNVFGNDGKNPLSH